MNITQLGKFLDEIRLKSLKGRIPWKGTADDESFSAVVSEGRYVLKAFGFTVMNGDERTGPPTLAIVNKQNQLLIDISASMEGAEQAVLTEIFELAQRKALGIEDAMQDILGSLIDDDDIPF